MARWHAPQLIELQIHALNIIQNLISLVPQHIHEIRGHQTLAVFLQTYKDKPRSKAAMQALLSASTFDFFKADLQECHLVDTLLEVVANSQESGTLQLRELSFNILSNICTECRQNQKEFRRLGGIESLRENLTFNDVDQSGNTITFLLSVLDCLSNAVFGNKRSELHFLDIEGVQGLLDLIETCTYTLKRLALSCLCSILENNKSFQYVVEWSSRKNSQNATQLLIKLYQEEDKRFGVQLGRGILQNIERPLFPKLSYLISKYASDDDAVNSGSMSRAQLSQQNLANSQLSNHDAASINIDDATRGSQKSSIRMQSSTKASRILRQALKVASQLSAKEKYNQSYINQMLSDFVKSYDLRGSIFATFFRVGFELHELNCTEKQYMEIIKLYPYLKNGEIWKDIKEEIDDLNIKPTSDDCHWVETSVEESREQTVQATVN